MAIFNEEYIREFLFKEYKKDNKNTTKSKYKNKKDYTIEEKQEYDYLFKTLCKKLASYLKKYAIDNKFPEKYRKSYFDINEIKQTNDGVQITTYQNGIEYGDIDDWEKKNPNKDWQKAPEFNNDWYVELLGEGKKSANKIFKDIQKSSDDWALVVDTGDGDEGIICIEIEKYNKGD